ncbi:MAG TPA: xanthine dehydrogenase family protein molybdopterin-binding subunit [Candidatus Limnocylindria bacterium]|nr:xanthine dehydrogenase family protein molybdopterin-binding subunit [Candidatus Limnocylindria bacterium]
MTAIGVDVKRVDGFDKVTGGANYTADIVLPNMLYAKVLRSTHPHARLLKVDGSRAEQELGVVTLTRSDLTDLADPFYGAVVKDQSPVAIDAARYVGDPIAAVAAEERDIAEEALDLIEVEYESLPSVTDPLEAMRPDATIIHADRRTPEVSFLDMKSVHFQTESNVCSTYHVEQGDVEAGFAESDEVFEDTYTVPMIQHGHIEPHATTAYWTAAGSLVVYTSTQNPSVIRTQLAELFELPESRVRIIVPYVGGGYGAKTYPKLEPLVAALARKARRPVQLVLTREEVFMTSVRHAAVVRIKTGVKRDGTLVARKVHAIYDTGAYADIGPRTAKNGGYASGGPYRIPNQHLTSDCVYTNKPPSGAFRGFGVPQVCWAYESQMDDIARRLNLDPVEFRQKNLVQENDVFITGDTLVSVGLGECLDQAANAIGWTDTASATAIATDNPDVVRGLGLSAMIKSTMTPSNSAAAVRLNSDGSAVLMTSSVEIGQGPMTSLAQIVAESLGLPVERVSVSFPDTDHTPYDQSTSSSRTTFSMGHAAQQACAEIRAQVLQIAADELEVAETDLEIVDGRVRVKGSPGHELTMAQVFKARFGTPVGSLFGGYDFQTEGGLDPNTGKGRASAFWFLSSAAAEVEVDKRTGKVRVLRAVCATDVGKAINPRQCDLQNEGSMLTALGSALFEEMLFDNGQPINSSFLDYMLPSMEDYPERFQSLLIETPHPDGPYGAKGMGEAALGSVAPAIGNAVANALGGVRIHDLPLRPERIVAALNGGTI